MSGIEAGKAFVKFILEDKEFKKSLKGMGERLKNVGKIGLAVTGPLVAGFTAATAAFTSAGDQLAKMSLRTGLSVESLSELKYAADQSGTSIGAIEKAAKKMQVGLLDASKGTGTLFESLENLGVTVEQLEQLSPEQQFLTLSRAIASVEDPSKRAALAQKVFGRAGTELLPLLAEGADGMDALRARAHELGLTLDTDAANAAVILGDNLDDLKSQVFSMAVQVGAAIAGPLTEFARSIQPILAGIIGWIKTNPELVVTIAKVTAAISAASTAVFTFGIALSFLSKHPIVFLLTTIAAGAAAAAAYFWDWSDAAASAAKEMDGLPDAAQLKAQADAMALQVRGGMTIATSAMAPNSAVRNVDHQAIAGTRESNDFLARIAAATEGTYRWFRNQRAAVGFLAGAE